MQFNRKIFDQLFFIFCGGTIGGVVFLGITSSFSLMLYEKKFKLEYISLIMLATLAYSWKFLLSPYVKKIIQNYSIKKFIVLMQILILILFSTLGIFSIYKGIILACVNVLLLAIVTASHDIICSYIKINNFEKKDLGLVVAVSNTGFRIGILLSTGILLYLADKIGWEYSFLYCIFPIIFLSIISVLLLNIKNVEAKEEKKENKSPIKNLIQSVIMFCKNYPVILILLIAFCFKVSDSTVNATKVMLLSHLNFSKVMISNILHIPGVFCLIIGGFIAGIASYKYNVNNCLKYSLLLQILVCFLFFYMCSTNNSIIEKAIILNISSLIFGFSNVIYRTFMDTISRHDININTVLASIGPLFRTILQSASMLILKIIDWNMFYLVCAMATLPGIYICYKSKYKQQLFHQ